MAFASESIGTLVMDISIFGLGMALSIIALVFAASKSITNEKKHWAILFAALSWTVALIMPTWYGGVIFGFGAFALTLSFMPLLEIQNDPNIVILAVIIIFLNLLMLMGVGAYSNALSWQTDFSQIKDDIMENFNNELANVADAIPLYKLCRPNQLEEDGTPCETDTILGSFNPLIFVPTASMFTMGTYLTKVMFFVGSVLLAPIILASTLITSNYFQNALVAALMTIFVLLWEIAIFYKTISYITGNWGKK